MNFIPQLTSFPLHASVGGTGATAQVQLMLGRGSFSDDSPVSLRVHSYVNSLGPYESREGQTKINGYSVLSYRPEDLPTLYDYVCNSPNRRISIIFNEAGGVTGVDIVVPLETVDDDEVLKKQIKDSLIQSIKNDEVDVCCGSFTRVSRAPGHHKKIA